MTDHIIHHTGRQVCMFPVSVYRCYDCFASVPYAEACCRFLDDPKAGTYGDGVDYLCPACYKKWKASQ